MNGQHPQDEDEFLAEAKRQSAAAGPPSAADPFLAEAQRQASQKPKPPRKSLQTRALGMGLGAAEAMGIRAGRTPLQTAGDIGGGFMQMAGTVPALLAPLPLKQRIAPLREAISGQAETFKRALADDPKAQGAALVALLGALSPIHSIAKYGRGAVAPPPSTPPSGPSGAPMAPGPRSLLPRAPLEEPHGLDIEAAPRQEYAARATPEAPVVPGEAGTRIRPVEPSPGASSVSPADQLVLKLREALGLGELEEPNARSFPEPPVAAAAPPRPASSAPLLGRSRAQEAPGEAPVVQNARVPEGVPKVTPRPDSYPFLIYNGTSYVETVRAVSRKEALAYAKKRFGEHGDAQEDWAGHGDIQPPDVQTLQGQPRPKGPKPQTPEAIANAERLGREGGDNPYYPGNELWQAFERGKAQPPEAPAEPQAPLDPQERRGGIERRATGAEAQQMADVRERALAESVDPQTLTDDEALFALHGRDFEPSTDPSAAVALRVGGHVFKGKSFQEAATRAIKKTRAWPLQDWEYDAIVNGRYPGRRSGDPELPVEMGYETIHGDFVSHAEKATRAQKAVETLSAQKTPPRTERRLGERRGGALLAPREPAASAGGSLGASADKLEALLKDLAEAEKEAQARKTTQVPEQAAAPPEGEPPLVESFPSPLLRSSAELRDLAAGEPEAPPLEFELQGGEGLHKVARVRDLSGVEGDLILDRSSGDWTVYGTLKGTLSDAFKQRLQDRLGAEGVHTPLVYRTRGEQTLVNKAPRAKGRALPPSENLSIEGIAERERLQGELEQLQAQFDQIAHTPGNEQRAAQLGTKMDNIRRRQRKLTEGRGLGEAGFLRIKGTPGAQLSPAEQAVHDRIGVGVKALATPKREWWHWFAQKTGETTHTAGVLERQAAKAGRQLPMPQRARLWMKAYLDSPKRMENAIYGTGPGHFDPQSGAWQQSDAPGLSTILEPIKGDATKVAQWRALLIAERAAAYERQGFATGIDPAAAADVVRTAPADVRAVAQGARYWMDAILDGAVQNGALPDWLAALWRDAYPEYVPYERVFDESGAPRKGGFGARSAGGIRPPSKRVKGSEELIGDPAETIPDYGRRWIRYTDLHRAAKSVVDLIDQNRDLFGDLAVKLDSKPLTPSTAQAAIGELLSEKSLKLEGGTLRLYNAASNAVETWKLEPIVADMFEGMTGQEWGMVTEILAATKGGLQFGVTNNPFFGLKNWMRDNFGRPTVSEATSVSFSGGALGELARRSPESKRFHAMGGGFGVIQESQGGMGALRRALPGRSGSRAIQAERQARAEKLVGKSRVLTRPLGALADLLKKSSVPFEESTRAAEFAKQKQLGRSDLESYVETQETMGNFAEHGSAPWMRWLNHVTPFLNPKMQGLRRAAQVGAKRPGITALKAVATLTVPTLALYMLNKDDKEIQQLRQGPGGYNYWYLRVSPNTVVKLPKPFLQGAVFATAFEHWLDSWRGEDPDGFARTARDMGNELWQTSVNPLFGTAYGIATNRDPYSNVPLVPADQANVLPEEQTGRHPSPTLTKLSHALPKAARFSPAQAQFALSQHGGTLGREGLRLADILSAADEQPAPGGADIPFANMFVARTPSTSTGPIRDVYGEAKRPLETLNTLRYLAGKGQAKELRRFVDEYQAEIGQGAAAEPAVKIMSQLAELIERVEKAPGMSPEVRAQTRDELIRRLNAVAEVLHSQAHTLAAPAPKR